MIESHFHPLDEIERFGFTAHGLVNGNVTGSRNLLVGSTNHPLPYSWPYSTGDIVEFYDTHLLKVPGIAPVVLPPEEYLAERAAGRTWQHYAILSEDRCMLFGTPLQGWVCIDPAGQRWIVRTEPQANTGSIRADEPLTMTIQVRPFGYLDEAVVPWHNLTVTLDDLGQVGDGLPYPPSGSLLDPNDMILRLGSVASHGRSAVLEIHGTVSLINNWTRRRIMPAGFLLLELSGNGPTFTPTLTVMRTRAETLGEIIANSEPEQCAIVALGWEYDEVPETQGGQPGFRATATVTSVDTPVSGAPYTPVGVGFYEFGRRDRVLGIVYDDADNLVEMTADSLLRLDFDYAPFALDEADGELSAWRPADATPGWEGTATGSVTVTASRTMTEVLSATTTIRRNGAVVSTAVSSGTNSVIERRAGDGGATLRWDGTGYSGRYQIPDSTLLAFRSYTRTTTWQVDEGAGATTWGHTYEPFEELYTLQSRLSSEYVAAAQSTYLLGPWLGVFATEEYGGARLELQRLANNLWGVRITTLGGSSLAKARIPFLVAPQAEWFNDLPTDSSERNGSYHPYTHEIATSRGSTDIPAPFVWS